MMHKLTSPSIRWEMKRSTSCSRFSCMQRTADKYDKVIGKSDAHFCCRRHVIFECAKFNMRQQEEGEAVDTFITALYALAKHCSYGSLHDEMIRDCIIVGIHNRALSEWLQLDPGLTLAKAITQVCKAEAVKLQQPLLGASCGEKPNIPVTGIQRGKGGCRGEPSQTSGSQNSEATNHKVDTAKACSRCGKPVHARADCPAKTTIGRK